MRNPDGTALKLSITNWAIQNLDEYDELARVDYIDAVEHSLSEVDTSSFASVENGMKIEVVSEAQENLYNVGYEGTEIELLSSFTDGEIEGELSPGKAASPASSRSSKGKSITRPRSSSPREAPPSR